VSSFVRGQRLSSLARELPRMFQLNRPSLPNRGHYPESSDNELTDDKRMGNALGTTSGDRDWPIWGPSRHAGGMLLLGDGLHRVVTCSCSSLDIRPALLGKPISSQCFWTPYKAVDYLLR
jgi:hypothetical protein